MTVFRRSAFAEASITLPWYRSSTLSTGEIDFSKTFATWRRRTSAWLNSKWRAPGSWSGALDAATEIDPAG